VQGFAFVSFAEPAGLEAACQLDRSEHHGKHIFVAPSRPAPGQQQGGGGGRDGGRGGGGGGGGRDGGRGGGFGGPPPGGPKHRSMIDLGAGQPAAGGGGRGGPPLGFVPRAAALQGKPQGGAGAGGAAAGEAPKSNADFRSMFLAKK
jgi:translation initiation factor IF-2